MAIHQCAFFCNNPHLVHERAIRLIAKYLASTSTHVDLTNGNCRLTKNSVVFKPSIEKGIECYVDAEFSGVWP